MDTTDTSPDADPNAFRDVPNPVEVARYLSEVFKDPESSSFERTQASVGLEAFWLGAEMNRFTQNFTFAMDTTEISQEDLPENLKPNRDDRGRMN